MTKSMIKFFFILNWMVEDNKGCMNTLCLLYSGTNILIFWRTILGKKSTLLMYFSILSAKLPT